MVGGAREAELQDVPAPAVGVALQELHPAPGTRGRPLRRETRRDGDGLDLVAEGSMSRKAPKVFCDYCSGPTQLVEDSEVYSRPQQKTSAQTGVFCALAILSPFRFC